MNLITIWQCLSVCPIQGFSKLNVNHLRDLGVVELGFGNTSRRPMINFQRRTVGEGNKLSQMSIRTAQIIFQC